MSETTPLLGGGDSTTSSLSANFTIASTTSKSVVISFLTKSNPIAHLFSPSASFSTSASFSASTSVSASLSVSAASAPFSASLSASASGSASASATATKAIEPSDSALISAEICRDPITNPKKRAASAKAALEKAAKAAYRTGVLADAIDGDLAANADADQVVNEEEKVKLLELLSST